MMYILFLTKRVHVNKKELRYSWRRDFVSLKYFEIFEIFEIFCNYTLTPQIR